MAHTRLPRNERELRLWKGFHPESHISPEFEFLVQSRDRLELLEEYYKLDPIFRKEVKVLAEKITGKKIPSDKAIESFDNLLLDAHARLLAERAKLAEQEFIAHEKRIEKLHADLHPES